MTTQLDQKRLRWGLIAIGLVIVDVIVGITVGFSQGIWIGMALFSFIGVIFLLVAVTPAIANLAGYEQISNWDDLETGTQFVLGPFYFFITLGILFLAARILA